MDLALATKDVLFFVVYRQVLELISYVNNTHVQNLHSLPGRLQRKIWRLLPYLYRPLLSTFIKHASITQCRAHHIEVLSRHEVQCIWLVLVLELGVSMVEFINWNIISSVCTLTKCCSVHATRNSFSSIAWCGARNYSQTRKNVFTSATYMHSQERAVKHSELFTGLTAHHICCTGGGVHVSVCLLEKKGNKNAELIVYLFWLFICSGCPLPTSALSLPGLIPTFIYDSKNFDFPSLERLI